MAELKQNYNPLEELMNDGSMETSDRDIDEGFGGPVNQDKTLLTISVQDLDDPSKNQLPIHEGQPLIDQMSSIDMECSVCEDDLDDDMPKAKRPLAETVIQSEQHVAEKFDFGDGDELEQMKKYNDEIDFKDKQLVNESDKKDLLKQGTPTKNTWKDLSKKYQKTQQKGSWGWYEARKPHGHWSGDPEQDMKDFNHDMGASVAGKGVADGGIGMAAPAASSAPAGGDAGGMGESKNNTTPDKYSKQCKTLLEEMGFDICKVDNGCHLVDLNKGKTDNPIETVIFTTPEEMFNLLKDYIDDFILCPLCDETGEFKDNCNDWVNWYTPAKQEMYPGIKNDIDNCDMICNHCKEIKF